MLTAINHRKRAFTLIELLVVVAIIAMLISILLPSLSRARESARAVACSSNVRQLAVALIQYSNDFEGLFPPNATVNGNYDYWFNEHIISTYLPHAEMTGTGSVGGPIFECPSDIPESARSYTMNLYASSAASYTTSAYWQSLGTFFNSSPKESSKTILLGEEWSVYPDGQGNWYADAAMGGSGTTPGQRFLGVPGFGYSWSATRLYGETLDCEIDYSRHSDEGDYMGQAVGRTNFAYVDGHAATKKHTDLANPNTGKSNFDSIWSSLDYELE